MMRLGSLQAVEKVSILSLPAKRSKPVVKEINDAINGLILQWTSESHLSPSLVSPWKGRGRGGDAFILPGRLG